MGIQLVNHNNLQNMIMKLPHVKRRKIEAMDNELRCAREQLVREQFLEK